MLNLGTLQVATLREEQDGMIEGMDELRGEMRRLVERVEAAQRQQADLLQSELNKIRSQFREAMRRAPVAEHVMPPPASEGDVGGQVHDSNGRSEHQQDHHDAAQVFAKTCPLQAILCRTCPSRHVC